MEKLIGSNEILPKERRVYHFRCKSNYFVLDEDQEMENEN